MKKKLIGMTVIAAVMTAAMSITAFAGWVQTSNGWVYYREDGSQVWSGWFTDPADGSIYYIDPDGYMMTETRVSGYWLGADGRRVDKTEEEIAREAARVERENNKAAPSQDATQAKSAAQAAKKSTTAISTTRRAYLAEMKVFMDKYYLDTAKVLTNEHVRSGSTVNNIETTYRYSLEGQGEIISTSLWTVSLKNSINYKTYSADIVYNRAILGEDTDVTHFDTLFKNMTIAALGDTTGTDAYNGIFEQLGNGVYNFESSGNTDAGNYYTLSCGDGIVKIQVTCSEITESASSDEAAAETAEEDVAETPETTPSSSVITVGAAADTDDSEEDTTTDTTSENAAENEGTE